MNIMIEPLLQTILTVLASTGILSYLGGRFIGFVRKKTNDKVAIALETAIQLGTQLVLSGPTRTPEATMTALKGVFAIQFAKAGIYEAQRKPIQPIIDQAISQLVTRWYQHTKSELLPPIANKVLNGHAEAPP